MHNCNACGLVCCCEPGEIDGDDCEHGCDDDGGVIDGDGDTDRW